MNILVKKSDNNYFIKFYKIKMSFITHNNIKLNSRLGINGMGNNDKT